MALRRSSADPAALSQFATATLDALTALRARSDAATRSLDTLASARSDVDLPGTGDVTAELADLVTDWEHLGTFARDVANGFYSLLGEVGYHGGVVTFADSSLTRLGIVGYADRDEAIAAAEAMAERFRDLRAESYEGSNPRAVHDLLALAERGQYDPAFAVTLSEAIGVRGYVDLTAMIRHAYQGGGDYEPVPQAGLDGVEVLATTLSTALATLPGLPAGEGSPATAGWARGERLDPAFLDDLAGGLDVPAGQSNIDFPIRTNTDLSVLLSLTAPPTSVAVTIANGRLTPLLRDADELDARSGDEGDDWGDHGGRITNYATMLGRDPDASARWLDAEVGGTQNIDLILRRNPDHDLGGGHHAIDVDGGRALAEVVEHGVTHTDDTLRATLVERAIEVIGGDQHEIRNPHLPDALAHGITENMDVVDSLINDDWSPETSEPPGQSALDTHDFLVEVARDRSASTTLASAVEDWSLDRFRDLPPPGTETPDGRDARIVALEQVGQVQGTFIAAESEVVYDSVDEFLARQEMRADTVNFAVGVFPFGEHVEQVIGPVNDAFDVGGFSLGEVFSRGNPAEEYENAREMVARMRLDADLNNRILLAVAAQPEHVGTPVREMTEEETRALLRWAERANVADEGQNDVMAGLARAADHFVVAS